MKLKVSEEQALKEIKNIPHTTCLSAIGNNWKVYNGEAYFKSFCWLFCWAKTGLNSNKAKCKAREVFNKLFYISYEEFKNNSLAAKASEYRYKDVESEDREALEELLEIDRKSV